MRLRDERADKGDRLVQQVGNQAFVARRRTVFVTGNGNSRNVRLNLQVIEVDRSPVNSLLVSTPAVSTARRSRAQSRSCADEKGLQKERDTP